MARSDDWRELLSVPRVERESVAKLFEEADPAERIRLTEAVDGRGQSRLWAATRGERVTIDEMVPRSLGPRVPVIFHGKNSLPVFTRFQKRFCRPDRADASELWGYNHQPTRWLAQLTGPGYFVARDASDRPGEVAVDYRSIPSGKPESWPELVDNRYRLSRFIFNGMVDYLRRVSEHLLIGRATRDNRDLPNYFLLCREDPKR